MILLPFGYPFENELAGEINYAHVLYEFKNFPEELKTKYMEASSNLTLSSPNDLSRLGNLAGGAGGNLSDISRLLKK